MKHVSTLAGKTRRSRVLKQLVNSTVLEGVKRTEFYELPARYEFYDKRIDSDILVRSTRTVLTHCTGFVYDTLPHPENDRFLSTEV
jgi:hypothetical protein